MRLLPANRAYNNVPTLFDDFLNTFFDEGYKDSRLMALDVVEKDDAFEVKANFPGIARENIHLSLKDNDLFIETEEKTEKEENGVYHLKERFCGKYCRSIRLPENCDRENITAKLENGVLVLRIPKMEPKPKVQIAVN